MSPASTPRALSSHDRDLLLGRFTHFLGEELKTEPLYAALCRIAIATPDILQLLAHATPEQRRPNLLLAAVHDIVLSGSQHDLAGYFPSVGGRRHVDDALQPIFMDFCQAYRDRLVDTISHRTTQTNEVGRCAVLTPILFEIAAWQGKRDLALLDLGCSAGLNLGVDRYRYYYGRERGEGRWDVMQQDDPLVLPCEVTGEALPAIMAESSPYIVQRYGIDPEPCDIMDDASVRWLRACIWPHDKARRERLDHAVRLNRQWRFPVIQVADCTAALEEWAASVPNNALPVVFNSWVLTYMPPKKRQDHIRRTEALIQSRGLAWISAEEPGIVAAQGDGLGRLARHSGDTLWTVATSGPSGPRYEDVAVSHPHGKWMHWRADAATAHGGQTRAA